MSKTDKQKVLYLPLIAFQRCMKRHRGARVRTCALFTSSAAYFFLTFGSPLLH